MPLSSSFTTPFGFAAATSGTAAATQARLIWIDKINVFLNVLFDCHQHQDQMSVKHMENNSENDGINEENEINNDEETNNNGPPKPETWPKTKKCCHL